MTSPFIYVAALRRTGSTLLAEALSEPPHAWVFREPGWGNGQFRVKAPDDAIFQQQGIDLQRWSQQLQTLPPASRMRFITDTILPELHHVVQQIGIKEIRHRPWQQVLDCFPDARVIMTGRDPRDIFLSLAHKIQQGRRISWQGEFTPQTLSAHLLEEFSYQLEILQKHDYFLVRYEDICVDPDLIQKIRFFVQSSVTDSGMIGQIAQHNAEMYGSQIKPSRVRRWAAESDPDLVNLAQETWRQMPEYNSFWGYEQDGWQANRPVPSSSYSQTD